MKKENLLKKCRNLNKYLGRCGVSCGDGDEQRTNTGQILYLNVIKVLLFVSRDGVS